MDSSIHHLTSVAINHTHPLHTDADILKAAHPDILYSSTKERHSSLEFNGCGTATHLKNVQK